MTTDLQVLRGQFVNFPGGGRIILAYLGTILIEGSLVVAAVEESMAGELGFISSLSRTTFSVLAVRLVAMMVV